jgi:hypothetical protein
VPMPTAAGAGAGASAGSAVYWPGRVSSAPSGTRAALATKVRISVIATLRMSADRPM